MTTELERVTNQNAGKFIAGLRLYEEQSKHSRNSLKSTAWCRLDRVLLVISPFYRGCAMQFGGSGATLAGTVVSASL
jgi:hypothetical protein